MANPPQRVQAQRPVHTTSGPVSGVPCPWGCGHLNDFRPLVGQDQGGMGEGGIGMETGAVFGCDKCKRKFKIMEIRQVTVVKVRPFAPRAK